MSRVKSVLLRLDVRPAGKLSHCTRNKKHEIKKDETRFLVKEPGPGTPERGYCATCALEMLDKAINDATALRDQVAAREAGRST